MAVPTTAAKPRGIRVRTAHATEAEFIAAFIELVDDGTIFAPTEKMKPIGADCAFSLELADGTAMVRGLGVIRNVWPSDDSPFGRPGIHIKIDQLTTGTEPIFQKLLEARTASAHKPRTRPAPSTHQLWGPPAGPPTEEMLAVEPEEPEVQELPHKITRELKSPTPPEDLTHEAFMEDPAIPGKASRAGTIPNLAPVAPVPHPRLASAPIIPLSVPAAEDDAALVAKAKPWWLNARVGGVFAAGLLLGLLMSFVFGGGDDDSKKVATSAAPAVVAKAEPAKCPPPPEPTALAAAPVEETEPPVETKARAGRNKQVAAATPAPKKTKTSSIATKTGESIKPSAFSSIKAATTPSTKTASKAPAVATTTKATTTPTKTTTTKTAVAPTKTAVATTTKTSATTKPGTTTAPTKPTTTAATKPASTAAKTTVATTKPTTTTTKSVATTKPTTTKPATVATTKPVAKKKGGCSSLDCL